MDAYTIALAILAIGLLILLHELGHFLVARACGMKVYSFSIGFGPALLQVRGRGTEYRLGLLPLGGYVRIAGMAPGDGTPEDEPGSFARKPAWQRFLVIAAGPAVNWLFAYVLLAGLFMGSGVGQPSHEALVGAVEDRSPAATVGLRAGDRVVRVGEVPVASWEEMGAAIRSNAGKPVDLTVEREGASLTLRPTVGTDGRLGIRGSTVVVKLPPGEALVEAFVRTGEILGGTVKAMVQAIQRKGDARLMGPVGIVSETAEAAASGWTSLLGILVAISLGLSLMNLLPLPALDGGRLIFILLAMIRRRPVDARVEAVVHAAGFILLLGVLLWATLGDLGGRKAGSSSAPAPTPTSAAPDAGPAGPQQPPVK